MDAIIKLFNSSATNFATNGLGFLSETTSCEVHEELNGEFELQMEYPLSGRLYSQIQLNSLIVAKPNPYDSPQAFRVYQISRPLNGLITINAHHISYDMSGIPVMPFESASNITTALSRLKSNAKVSCPFNLSKEGTFDNITFHHYTPSSLRAALGGEEESILAYYGGEIEFDNFNVIVHKNRGFDHNVTIRYGKNLTAMDHKEEGSSKYDGIMPYWYVTDENGIPSQVTLCTESGSGWNSGIFYFNEAPTNPRIFPLDISGNFQEAPTNENFIQATSNYISENNLENPIVSTTVSALILGQTTEHYGQIGESLEKVSLGDLVHIEYIEMGIHATAKCTATTYDVLTNKYTDMKLGEGSTSLADKIVNQQRKIDNSVTPVYVQQQASSAANKITGNLGGFVIIHSTLGKNQNPDEILITDNSNLGNAQKVWRWNLSGLGFSSNGYDYQGDWPIAITGNGEINANFITAGKIEGNLIKAGSIKADAISQEYTTQYLNDISASVSTVTSAFQAEDNRIRSSINQVSSDVSSLNSSISSITQDISGINAQFGTLSQGGFNLVLNSSGVNGTAYWDTAEGTLISTGQDSTNTSSGYYFSIPSGETMFQQVNVIKGQNYSFSCKYKQTTSGSSDSTIMVTDGQNAITIYQGSSASSSWTTRTNTEIVPESDSLIIYVTSGANSLLLADIMLTQGSTPANWTQAPNELYTTNIKMDKSGIHITSITNETETLIDSEQFAVLNKDTKAKILTVNGVKSVLTNAQVKSELLIGDHGKFVPKNDGFDIIILD